MYKYFSFSENSISNLLNHELYMSHFEAFNDPFECSCEVLSGFPKITEQSSRLQGIIKAWGFEDVSDHIVLENYDAYADSLKLSEPVVATIINRARISCFSKDADSLLMWSHYADGLRGYCIEFDPDYIRSHNEEHLVIMDVLYEDAPPKIDTAVMAVIHDQITYHQEAIHSTEVLMKHLGQDKRQELGLYEDALDRSFNSHDEIYQKMLATKPTCWKYENEVRVICQAKNTEIKAHFLKYPINAIKSFTIGEKMPRKKVETLYNIIITHFPHANIYIASKIHGAFELSIKEYNPFSFEEIL